MFTSQATLKRSSRVSSGFRELRALCALLVVAFALCVALSQSAAADPLTIKVGVIREAHSRETISILDIPPADDFIAGARVALDDNNTTGRFLDQSFSVVDAKLSAGEDPIEALKG